jgi:hypothetical protein
LTVYPNVSVVLPHSEERAAQEAGGVVWDLHPFWVSTYQKIGRTTGKLR